MSGIPNKTNTNSILGHWVCACSYIVCTLVSDASYEDHDFCHFNTSRPWQRYTLRWCFLDNNNYCLQQVQNQWQEEHLSFRQRHEMGDDTRYQLDRASSTSISQLPCPYTARGYYTTAKYCFARTTATSSQLTSTSWCTEEGHLNMFDLRQSELLKMKSAATYP